MLEKQFLNLSIIHCNLIQRPHVSYTFPSVPNKLTLFAFNLSAVHSHSLKNRIHHLLKNHPQAPGTASTGLLHIQPPTQTFVGSSRNPLQRTSESVTPKTVSEGGNLLLFLAPVSSVSLASAHFIAQRKDVFREARGENQKYSGFTLNEILNFPLTFALNLARVICFEYD